MYVTFTHLLSFHGVPDRYTFNLNQFLTERNGGGDTFSFTEVYNDLQPTTYDVTEDITVYIPVNSCFTWLLEPTMTDNDILFFDVELESSEREHSQLSRKIKTVEENE